MRMQIIDGWLWIDGRSDGVRRALTPHVGARMVPSLIVAHDTAGRLDRGSSVDWFLDPASKVSAHFVIERDGSITQLAACDRVTWHAGQSEWRGKTGLNSRAIGIEIVNPGALTRRGDGAVAWFGQTFDIAKYGIEERSTDAHGRAFWMPYDDRQIIAFDALVHALTAAYPKIDEVVGHYQIAPKRKVDPNPLFPARLLGQVARPRPVETTEFDVFAVQRRLASLGYFPGNIDGEMGPRLETALFAFQRQNRMAAVGRLDDVTVERLMADDAKPMPTAGRETITEQDLAGRSRIVDEQRSERTEAQFMTWAGIATTFATTFTSLGSAFKGLVEMYGAEIVLVAAGGGLALWGVRKVRRANRTIKARVDDARTGAHVGPNIDIEPEAAS